MNLATKALEFWDYQKQTELEYHRMTLKSQHMRTQNFEKQCNEKLVEAQNRINLLSHQLNAVKGELEASRKEAAELQEKYAERTRYAPEMQSAPSKVTIPFQAKAQADRTLRVPQATL